MTKSIKIRVTAKDIKRGIPCEHDRCAIAVAVRRVTGTHKKVGVDGGLITIGSAQYSLPPVAEQFVYDFDSGNVTNPFTFTATRA